jgi:DNA-binding CsgD family transcriptional regulator/GAF domain-containing protein
VRDHCRHFLVVVHQGSLGQGRNNLLSKGVLLPNSAMVSTIPPGVGELRLVDYAIFDRLIALTYDAGMNRDLWPQVAEAVRGAIGADVTCLFQRDIGMQLTVNEVTAMSGWTAATIAPYNDYYGHRDTRSTAVAGVPVGGVYADDRQMPFADVARSEIYQDYFKPLGLAHGIATPLFREVNRQGVLSAHRSLPQGGFPEGAILLLEALAPHLVRAFQLQRQIQRAEAIAGGLKLTLDHFPLPVFLLNTSAQLQHMNAVAAELLSRPGQPFRITQGRLRTNDARTSAELTRSIAQAADIVSGRTGAPVAILRLHLDGADFAVMAAPLRPSDQVLTGTNPLVAVFVSDPAKAPLLDTEILRQQFNLSGAEARLAASLAAGAALADIAEMRGVSVETLRTLLKRIFAKTGTGSQGQVIGLLERSLARLRR